MFTGIVTDVGIAESITQLVQGRRFRIASRWDLSDLSIGASVAHAGVCLTVVDKGHTWFETEAWEEALRLTTLGGLAAGSRLNLERSLKVGDELGGHMVSGHVDGIARIEACETEGGAVRFVVSAPAELARFIARKGSVALDGTSLTVNRIDGAMFDVLIIRHTLDVTTWGERRAGDFLNIEVDQMARYAARLAEFPAV